MKKLFVKLYQRFTGWKIKGVLPKEAKHAVLIAAPHTSNYDFYQGLMVFWHFDMKLKFLIKDFWMKAPWGWFMKPLGGIGVNRSRKSQNDFVGGLIKEFEKHPEGFHLMITPEGTRKRVRKWKTGFYRIAQTADVPLILCFTDSKTKTFGIGPLYYLTGDVEKDMEHIQAFYANFEGRVKEYWNPEIY
ncbi:MAG: 1-acyl-sn-glycerol-3-phosphate acyltransferase [Flavobacteriales bacterium]|jgi:1-acyl-sn-glycerol-3-phosphate acyltransferase|nr:1-acyl-sn-glycerol-3-phosphate acyltransferase [Flavobacteriales bacterium]